MLTEAYRIYKVKQISVKYVISNTVEKLLNYQTTLIKLDFSIKYSFRNHREKDFIAWKKIHAKEEKK